MFSLGIRNRLEVAEVDGDEGARGYENHDEYGPGVFEPAAGPARAEVLDLISVDVVGEMSFGDCEEGVVRVLFWVKLES